MTSTPDSTHFPAQTASQIRWIPKITPCSHTFRHAHLAHLHPPRPHRHCHSTLKVSSSHPSTEACCVDWHQSLLKDTRSQSSTRPCHFHSLQLHRAQEFRDQKKATPMPAGRLETIHAEGSLCASAGDWGRG